MSCHLLTHLAIFRDLSKNYTIQCFFTGSAAPTSASLIAYDDIVNGPFKTYLDLSKRIGDEVASIGNMVEVAFKAHRAYLEMASKAKKPAQVIKKRCQK